MSVLGLLPHGADKIVPFLAPKALKAFIPAELLVQITQPIIYQPLRTAYGIEAGLLPKICEVWLRARDAKQLINAAQVSMIVSSAVSEKIQATLIQITTTTKQQAVNRQPEDRQ